MQKQLTDAVRVLNQSRGELEMVAAGNGGLLVGGPEAVAAKALKRIADAERLIRNAQQAAKNTGAAIVQAVRAAGCEPAADPVAQTLAGYPVPTEGSRVNGQPVCRGRTFALITDTAQQMADAHDSGLKAANN